jgi:DnaJ-class molecular chaperone
MKRTILLAGLVLGVASGWAGLSDAEPTYIGAGKCKMCHKLQYDSWLETKHAKATENAKAAKDMTFEAACLGCHATNANETLAGVQCEACHGAGSDYKSIQVMKDRAKAVANGLVIPTQETCNRCHDGKDHHKSVKFDAAIVHAHKKTS